jgi:hypothetical protein
VSQSVQRVAKVPTFSLGSLLVELALFATPAAAQIITDGDSLKQGGVTYRL